MATKFLVPNDKRHLTACITCKLILTEDQFRKERTCPNCKRANLQDYDNLHEHTSGNFSGMIALVAPRQSWVAKWNGIVDLIPGMYAIDVKPGVQMHETIDENFDNDSDTEYGKDEREVDVKRERLYERNS